MVKKKLMVIDGSSLLFRAFYALPLLETREGIYTNAMYGFLSMMYSAIEENNPDYISVAFDKSGPTFRHNMYEEYKGNRTTPPEEIKQQFPMIKEILEAMNINYLESDEYEADDIAGTLAKIGEKKGLEVILVTGDRDYLQLATDKTKVVFTKRGISETDIYDRDKIIEEYEITPNQLIDLKGLMGDSSDNIPGVPGIGEVIGKRLIKEFGSIEGVYENIENVSGKKRKENLIENEKLAYLSRDLSRIYCDIPLDLEIEELLMEDPNLDDLMPLFERYEFKIFQEKYSDDYIFEEEARDDYIYKIVKEDKFDELIKHIEEEKKFSFEFVIEDEDYMRDEILYIGIKTMNSSPYLIDLQENNKSFFKEFKEIFENEGIKKISHDIKGDIILLFRNEIEIKGLEFDTMVAEYLADPSKNRYSINDISDKYLNYYGMDEEELLGKGKNKKSFSDLDEETLAEYISFKIDTVFKVENQMKETLEREEMLHLYYDIELPLTKVLASIQFYGFKVDKSELDKLDIEYGGEIKELTEEIHELAGSEFNVNSPKQLGLVLFDDLELPVIKRTKTGYSTNAEVLDKLKGKHPIIEKVLRYRQIVKLKSTYIDGMLELINEDTGRIHSTFNQTITTTGRISSTEPNLQNIPIRTHDGRQIRRAFVSEEGYKLVDADYSQIELRILAHISEDPKMIQAFKESQDIHTKTASEVFHVDMEDVTPELRDRAKAVNFGIVYGISDYGLSRDLDITRGEAKEYIDNYLKNYTKVQDYMDEIVEKGKEDGYVETILHRRRYVPELKAKNFNIRSFGERIAMNTPIQGSAADIIKIAMVRVYDEIRKRKLKSRMILQVHDELIIETVEDEGEEVKIMLKDIMESVIELDVPLIVDLKVGESWYDTL